jgi:outer membrane receptor protein involved in Fe transport
MVSEYSVSVPATARATSTSWRVKAAVAAALAGATTTPLFAQDEAPKSQGDDLTEVLVTGSRILRRDFDSDSPITTVSTESLQNTSEIGIDRVLARLPQVSTGTNQFNSAGDIQATPTNSPGIATVNLRGLGSNRTLVLLDGRRTQPNNASLVVDLNTIPASAIDSVEIITGGAGSTYGADAVAGVVNFKLKRNYQGVTVDAQSGQSFHGDGNQRQFSALLGSNFADNRGNALLGVTVSKRDAIFSRNRDFYAAAYTDPGAAGGGGFPSFGGYSGAYSQAAVDQVFGAKGYVAGDVRNSNILYFNPAATTAGATLFSVAQGAVDGRAAPGYTGSLAPDNKILSNGSLSSNTTDGYMSLPLTRYSVFAHGHYDVNDHVSFYVQANFDENQTKTQSGAYAPAVNQWAVTIPRDAAHPVPTELATLLNSRTTPNAAWTLNKVLDYVGHTTLQTTTNTYEMLAGVRGEIGVRDWTYDFFGSHGRTSQGAQYNGFVDLGTYQTLISMPNYGAGADFNNARIGLLAHCTSGLNPFVNTPVSQDCINILDSQLKTTTAVDQSQVELDVQGSLFALPTGDMRFAVGADYRKNGFDYRPDRGISTQNVNSVAIGLFDTTATSGSISVKEAYVELLAPLLKGLPLIKSLELNAGYRLSDYDTATGSVNTWKLTADWSVNDWIKFRGGRQVANRAPNVAELFSPAVFTTVAWPDHDPCSNVTRAPYGNVATNPNRAKVQALCSALSGGFPIDNNFTGNQSVFFPLGRDLTQGNPDVGPEDAKTWTIGTVLRSPWDAPALRRLTLSADYYSVNIEGAIAPASTAFVYQQCFNAFGTNPTYDPTNDYCKRILRLPTNGFWLATNAKYQNLGAIKTSGVDAQIDWSATTPFFGDMTGTVFANINANWLESYDVQNVAGSTTLHYVGAGGTGSGVGAGSYPRWKFYTPVGYTAGPATLSLAWRHLPETRNIAVVTNPASTVLPTDKYDVFDLSGRWSITSALSARFGVENVLDKQPPRVGMNLVNPGATTAAGLTDSGSYDVAGRRFYVGVTARF